jgi:hypothetical protein
MPANASYYQDCTLSPRLPRHGHHDVVAMGYHRGGCAGDWQNQPLVTVGRAGCTGADYQHYMAPIVTPTRVPPSV